MAAALLVASSVVVNAGENRAACAKKAAFEEPAFEHRILEPRVRNESRMESPARERPRFERAALETPTFEKPRLEKPKFEKECIESLPAKSAQQKKEFAFVPRDTKKKWRPMPAQSHKLHIISHHELRISRTPVRR